MIGLVIDATTREGIPFAVLNTVRTGDGGTETGFDGEWTLDVLPTDVLRIAHTSYKPVEVSATALADAGGIVDMQPAVNVLSDVVVLPHQQPKQGNGWLWALLALAALSSQRRR